MTWSMRLAPTASISTRSNPRAVPAQGGSPDSIESSSRLWTGRGGKPLRARRSDSASIRSRSSSAEVSSW